MPVLEVDGRRVSVGDEFLKLSPEDQQATVEEIAKSLPAKSKPVGVGDVVRATATGVPIVGGMLNKLNAATNAALAPVVEPFLSKGPETLDQPTFGERYSKSLDLQNKQDEGFTKEHPVVDTAAKVTGGVAGTLPLILAAPGAMGAAGTLPQMVTKGAMSGAGISAADAAVRGEDVVHGGLIGGAFGAGAPLVGRAVGKVVDAVRPKPSPVPQTTVRVGSTDVPMRPDQVTGDLSAAADAEAALKGAKGEPAQKVAQGFQDTQDAQILRASEDIAAGLDPTGRAARTAPQDAGAKVVDDLLSAESKRLAGENAALARTAAEGAALRGPAPVAPFEAAEAVGEGVAAWRGEAVQRTRDAYGRVKEEPGTFEPDMVRGLGSDIRTRLGQGEDAVVVNPQTTPQANAALGLIDGSEGTGLFQHTAPRPVGPVAEAAARAANPVGEDAVAALVAKGVNPERARAAVAKMDAAEPRSALEPHDVAVPDGSSVRVVPKVVEASALKTSADEGYNQSLQPRNRARAASGVQVTDMARNLNPNRLGVSSEADRGAPIVGPDRMVESGNGRVLAIRQAYSENGPAAQRYRDWLQSQGVDVSKYREPVLVRERATPMTPDQRKAFAVASNQAATLSMSAPERALADSKLLTPDTLSLIRNPADLGAAENRDFVRAFMQGVPATERAALMTANGELSSEGLSRMRNAVLGKAYGDIPVLSRIAESASDDVKSISNGLVAAAPEWAQLRSRIAAGEVPAAMDVTGDLVDAVSRTAKIRGKGQGLSDALSQTDAFTKQSAESEALQRLFYDADGKKAASSSQIGNALRHYAQEAGKVDAAPGLMLGMPEVTAADVLKTTAAKAGAPTALAKEVVEAAAPAASGPAIGEVGLKEMDSARKRLVTMFGDAKRAAMGPGGSPSDVRAMGRILNEFDQAILEAFEGGRFSGDSVTAAQLLKDARAAHAEYKQTFTRRGPGDEVGSAVEKILGRYADSKATPDQIMALSYGAGEPGGGKAAAVAQRLRTILGETSPEYAAYKQGLISHLIDTPAGSAPRSASATADRIEKFLDGARGKVLANTVLSPAERDGLRSYAGSLRASEPVPLSKLDSVEKIIARISGRDGNPPMTPGQVVDLLFSRSGRGDKANGPLIAQRLKRDLTPEGWTQVRQGMYEKLTNAGEGKIPFGPQALSQRIHEFLNESGKGLAEALFTPAERAAMKQLAGAYKMMIPPKGATNPSGTAWTGARLASKANGHLMAMLGAVHSGVLGAATGYAVAKGAKRFADSQNTRDVVRGFYGKQPGRAPSSSRLPIVLGQGTAPEVANQ